MNIIITGYTSALAQKLLALIDKKGHTFHCITRKCKTRSIDSNFTIIEGDITNKNFIEKIISEKKIDLFIHAAAITHSYNQAEYEEVNFKSTVYIVDALKKYNPECSMIFISSRTAGYKSGGYGISKIKAEDYIKNNLKNWLIFRPSEIFGTEKSEGIQKLISDTLSKTILFCPVNIKYKLYPVYIDDVVNIINDYIFNLNIKNQIITINGSEGYSYSELVKNIAAAANKKIMILPLPEFLLFFIKYFLSFFKIKSSVTPDQIDRLYCKKSIQTLNYKFKSVKDYIYEFAGASASFDNIKLKYSDNYLDTRSKTVSEDRCVQSKLYKITPPAKKIMAPNQNYKLRKINFLIFFCIFIVTLAIIIADNNVIGSDISFQMQPLINFVYNSGFSKWNPNIICGIPNIASISMMTFHPLSLLIYFKIITPENFFGFIMFLYLILSSALMYFWIYKKTGSCFSSVVSSIIFTLGGFTANCVFKGHYMLLGSYCLYPLIFYITDILLQKQSERSNFFRPVFFDLFFIFLFSLQILAGHPQQVYYECLILFPYIIFSNNELLLKTRIYTFCRIFILCSFSAALCAVQLIPSFYFSKITVRPVNAGLELAQQYSVSLSHLIQNIFPFFWGFDNSFFLQSYEDYSQFTGITALILLIAGLIFAKKNREILFWYLIALLTFLAAFGQYLPVFKILYSIIPGFKMFRGPIRLYSIVLFGISIISGLTLKNIIIAKKKDTKKILIGFTILLFFLCSILFFFGTILNDISKIKSSSSIVLNLKNAISGGHFEHILKNVNKSLLTGILFIIFISIYIFCKKKVLLALAIFVLISEYVLFFYLVTPENITKNSIPDKNSTIYKLIAADTGLFRIKYFPEQININRNHYISNLKNIDGYQNMISNNIAKFQCFINERDDVNRIVKSNRLYFENIQSQKFDLTCVKYIISNLPLSFSAWELAAVDKNEFLYRNIKSLPLFFSVKNLVFDSSIEYDFSKLSSIGNFSDTALIFSSQKSTGKTFPNNSNCKIDIISYSNDLIKLSVKSTDPGFIVNLEPYDKDWKIYINGQSSEFIKTNLFFRGFYIDSGINEVLLKYEPLYFYIGMIITIFTAGILISFLFYLWIKKI